MRSRNLMLAMLLSLVAVISTEPSFALLSDDIPGTVTFFAATGIFVALTITFVLIALGVKK